MDKDVTRLRKEVYDSINEANIERSKLTRLINEKIDELILGFSNTEEVSIGFSDLLLFEKGSKHYVNEDIYFEKISQSKNSITFLTYATEGGSFGVHYHDCVERCKVVSGSLIEKTRGYKVYKEDEEIIYAPNERHIPYATTDSVWEVTFYKKL